MNKVRVKSQALLNEQAILSCLVYIDLNPVRVDIYQFLESSEYTSVKQRIDQIKEKSSQSQPTKLAQLIAGSPTKDGIAFSLTDYLELADWMGCCIRIDKQGGL